ncbi:hypothetical protein B296_00038021 [Ensete ventricosum]|uniref:Transmembrane protein n=1 Tax=Ensete ventricosum TaxID=4639 RepID=A0A426XGK1_ENSVE|nr:hypothetical protein B296_00038021 [Ensete ventricosum]
MTAATQRCNDDRKMSPFWLLLSSSLRTKRCRLSAKRSVGGGRRLSNVHTAFTTMGRALLVAVVLVALAFAVGTTIPFTDEDVAKKKRCPSSASWERRAVHWHR